MLKRASNLLLILVLLNITACASLNLMKPASSSGNATASSEDSAITNRVNSAFVHDRTIPAFDIRVTTRNAIVTLKGTVANASIKNRAASIAAGVKGVSSVRNRLQTK